MGDGQRTYGRKESVVLDVPLGTNMATEILKSGDFEQRGQYVDYKVKEFKANNNFMSGYKGIVLGNIGTDRLSGNGQM